jgi:hypothetical protein
MTNVSESVEVRKISVFVLGTSKNIGSDNLLFAEQPSSANTDRMIRLFILTNINGVRC